MKQTMFSTIVSKATLIGAAAFLVSLQVFANYCYDKLEVNCHKASTAWETGACQCSPGMSNCQNNQIPMCCSQGWLPSTAGNVDNLTCTSGYSTDSCSEFTVKNSCVWSQQVYICQGSGYPVLSWKTMYSDRKGVVTGNPCF
jgi:hypothetical protein